MNTEACTTEDGLDLAFEHVRPQDLIARVAGVSLLNTVRVLRAAALVAEFLDSEEGDCASVSDMLCQGAIQDGRPAPLHDKPSRESVNLCQATYEEVYGECQDEIRDIHALKNDPYLAAMYESIGVCKN